MSGLIHNRKRNILIVIGGFIVVSVGGWIIHKTLDAGREKIVSNKQKKYIAVVMSRNNEAFTIPREFLEGFGSKTQLKNQNDEYINIRYPQDLSSIDQTERKAEELVNDENCVLIIGNSNSELTKITLNKILKSKNRPGFILPIATANNILLIADEENYSAILRMVPDNDNQANQIKSFIAKYSKSQKIAILVDEENVTYSEDLSNSIATKVRKNGGQIVLKRNYGNSTRLIDYLEKLSENTPEFIVFVGISTNGLLLVDEFLTFNITVPVIFTDGCTVKELIKKSSVLKEKAYFLSAASISDEEPEPTYKPIGKDTFKLLEQIISSVNGNSRKEIREHIEKNKKTFGITGGAAGDYQFNAEGNNTDMDFKIYVNNDGKLELVTGY